MRYLYAVAVSLLICHTVSFSQSVFKGKVIADDNSPLPVVSVMVKGTSDGTATNNNGEFSITVSKFPASLIFSYVGYEVKEVIVMKKDSAKYISIKLNPNVATMDEVVVIGYATMKKSSMSASVSSIRGETYASSLTGKVSGIKIDKSTRTRSKILTAGEL